MADTKNVLTPEELEALSSGIEDGSIESDTGINSDIEAVKHDLASEDSSLGMNLSAVNLTVSYTHLTLPTTIEV